MAFCEGNLLLQNPGPTWQFICKCKLQQFTVKEPQAQVLWSHTSRFSPCLKTGSAVSHASWQRELRSVNPLISNKYCNTMCSLVVQCEWPGTSVFRYRALVTILDPLGAFHYRKFGVILQCRGRWCLSSLQEASLKGLLPELLLGLTESLLQSRI